MSEEPDNTEQETSLSTIEHSGYEIIRVKGFEISSFIKIYLSIHGNSNFYIAVLFYYSAVYFIYPPINRSLGLIIMPIITSIKLPS